MRTLLAPAVLALSALLACAGAPASQAGPGGEKLYRSKCSACHRAYPPASRDAAAWAGVVEKMAPKAKLSAEERAQILEFLQANARGAPASGARP